MAVLKMIQVRFKTHQQAKRQAKDAKMPMKDYIQQLLDKDQK